MTKQIIAIGGGGFGRDPGKGIIEDYILKQSKKKKPNICLSRLQLVTTKNIKKTSIRPFQNLIARQCI